MSFVKYILWFVVVVLIVTAMFAFTAANTVEHEIDLLFIKTTTSLPVALTVTFAIGWLFGLVTTGLWAFRLIRERRTLKRSLQVSESEVSSLRNLPLNDAD
ncbi:MAG: LapA family protein [Woeseiaceae bacterium]|nr:LapA family protein [Woeseiaceae bacterium]